MANDTYTWPIIDTHGQSLTHMANHRHTRPIMDTHGPSLMHIIIITDIDYLWCKMSSTLTDAHFSSSHTHIHT